MPDGRIGWNLWRSLAHLPMRASERGCVVLFTTMPRLSSPPFRHLRLWERDESETVKRRTEMRRHLHKRCLKGWVAWSADRGYAAWKKELDHATWASSVQLETARLERGTTRRQKIGN